jgi:protoheme IX farnesyltransferase
LMSALILGGSFLWHAYKLMRHYSDTYARKTFRFSIVYLALLFMSLLVDHWVL